MKSHILSWAFFVFSTVIICSVQGEILDFDCRRKGVDCTDTGKCNLDTRGCDCNNDALNYMCRDETTDCDQDTYGTGCTMERIQVNCEADKMFININPHGTFSGSIYVNGFEDTEGCKLEKKEGVQGLGDYVTDKDKLQGYWIELQHSNPACGLAGEEDLKKTREFFIQYNDQFKASIDQKVTAKCVTSQNGVAVAGEVETIKKEDDDFKSVDVEGNVEIVQLELQTKDGNALPSEVALGSAINLVFTLTSNSGFKDFTVKNCAANNSESGSDARTIGFLQDSCPSDDGTALFLDAPSKSTTDEGASVKVTLSITAFMFKGSSAKVAFLCDVKLCENANDDTCNMPSCDSISSSTPTDAGGNETSISDSDGGNETSISDSDGGNETSISNSDGGNETSISDSDGGNETSIFDSNGGNETSISNSDGGNETSSSNSDGGNAPVNNADVDETPEGARRRRDVETVAQVSTQISVVDPDDIKKKETLVVKEEVDCMVQPEILALIIIMAVAVTILLLVVIICAYQNKTHQWKEAPARPEVTKQPLQTFSIPRLELSSSSHSSTYPPSV